MKNRQNLQYNANPAMKYYFTLFGILWLIMSSCNTQTNSEADHSRNDTLVTLFNEQVKLSVSLWGGAITDFRQSGDGINPFTWKLTREAMQMDNPDGAPFQGHFLCFGRWGSPTPGEAAQGIPGNGEPAENWWELVSMDESSLTMEYKAPLEKMNVSRQITISEKNALVVVREKYTNPNAFGRIFNVVQHPTAGRPFLSEASVVNSNAALGFLQSLAIEGLEKYEYEWPEGYADSLLTPLDLTRSDQDFGFVTTHIIEDDYGWITLSDPEHGLLLGYVWETSEYPWLHIWHGIQDGELWAKGLEFGTTGIGDTFLPEKRFTMDFHGRRNFEFYDAEETREKSYILFMINLPEDYNGIQSIRILPEKITLFPLDNPESIVIDLAGLNPWM